MWVSSFRDREAQMNQSMSQLHMQSMHQLGPEMNEAPAKASVFKCLFCGTTADEVSDCIIGSLRVCVHVVPSDVAKRLLISLVGICVQPKFMHTPTREPRARTTFRRCGL